MYMHKYIYSECLYIECLYAERTSTYSTRRMWIDIPENAFINSDLFVSVDFLCG